MGIHGYDLGAGKLPDSEGHGKKAILKTANLKRKGDYGKNESKRPVRLAALTM